MIRSFFNSILGLIFLAEFPFCFTSIKKYDIIIISIKNNGKERIHYEIYKQRF